MGGVSSALCQSPSRDPSPVTPFELSGAVSWPCHWRGEAQAQSQTRTMSTNQAMAMGLRQLAHHSLPLPDWHCASGLLDHPYSTLTLMIGNFYACESSEAGHWGYD